VRTPPLPRTPLAVVLAFGLGLAAASLPAALAHGGDPTRIHACVSQSGSPRGQLIVYAAPGLPLESPFSQCGSRGLPLDLPGTPVFFGLTEPGAPLPPEFLAFPCGGEEVPADG
jgi:hypothetical protein